MPPKISADWHVYLLECGDGTLYCGATNNLGRRVAQHNSGKGGRYTRSRLPVKLFAKSPPLTKSKALSLEAMVKKTPRSEKVRIVEAG